MPCAWPIRLPRKDLRHRDLHHSMTSPQRKLQRLVDRSFITARCSSIRKDTSARNASPQQSLALPLMMTGGNTGYIANDPSNPCTSVRPTFPPRSQNPYSCRTGENSESRTIPPSHTHTRSLPVHPRTLPRAPPRISSVPYLTSVLIPTPQLSHLLPDPIPVTTRMATSRLRQAKGTIIQEIPPLPRPARRRRRCRSSRTCLYNIRQDRYRLVRWW